MIHGRGLAGTVAGNPGLQRGMRDGLGPHLPDTRGGVFRDFARYGVGGFRGRRAGIGGLGAAAPSQTTTQFAQQVAIARDALSSLASKAQVIFSTTTNVQDKETARIAFDFAARQAPARLDRISAAPTDPASVIGLASIQGATQRITEAMRGDVMDALLSRFLTMLIVPVGGMFLSAEVIDQARELENTVVDTALERASGIIPTIPGELPEWVIPAAALGGVVLLLIALRN
jgi:hypothetical protein